MNLVDLKTDIQNNKFQNVYIFYGDEHVVRDIYIDIICNRSGKQKNVVDSFASISSFIGQKSILLPQVYVVNNDMDLLKDEKQWGTLLHNKSNTNIIILYYTSLDERTKFFKTFKDKTVKFDYLDEKILIKYITKEYDLSEDRCVRLINRCNSDYGKILNVCKKADILSKVDNDKINHSYDILVKENQVPISLQSLELDFINSILDRHLDYSMFVYNLIKDNINTLGILSALYTSFRNMLISQSCSSKNISSIIKRTGLDKYVIERSLKNHNYTISEMVKTIKHIREYEMKLKQGVIEERNIIFYLIVDLEMG